MKYTILDLETTGIPPKGANYETDYATFPYILSMAWKCIKDGVEVPTVEYVINNPGVKVTPKITAINGITQEMCDASHYTLESTIDQFTVDAFGSDLIIGHNIYFDTSIIKANVMRIVSGGKIPIYIFNKISDILHKDRRIDTMRAGTKLCGKWPKLIDLYYKLFLKNFDRAHTAAGDVQACHECFEEMLKMGLIKLPVPVVVLEEET